MAVKTRGNTRYGVVIARTADGERLDVSASQGLLVPEHNKVVGSPSIDAPDEILLLKDDEPVGLITFTYDTISGALLEVEVGPPPPPGGGG